MAFDHSPHSFTLEADMDPLGAVLLAGAVYCLKHEEREWWSQNAIPFEGAFNAVQALGETDDPDTPPCESGGAACWLLLLMREAMRGA